MTPRQAQEALQRATNIQNEKSQRRGYRGPTRAEEQSMATLGLLSEGVNPDSFKTQKI